MTAEEIYNKTNEIVSRFKNGEELYRNNALFNTIVQMLVRGESEYNIIEMLIKNQSDIHNAFTQYINRDTRPMLMNPNPLHP